MGVAIVAAATAPVAAGAPMLGEEVAPQPTPEQDPLAERNAFGTRSLAVRAEPSLAATPRATCGPGSRPEPGIQGRVPPGEVSANGFTCNTAQVGHEGTAGGYKVERFVDRTGRECAYYDTTLLFASNAYSATLDGHPTGTAVLDMSDPSRPVRTDTLVTSAMQSPHESLLVNERRGLLAAVQGNPFFAPGVVDIYDLNADCRHPVLQSSLPVGVLGHESGFALDGKTFYASSIDTGQTTAIDVTNPRLPATLWVGQFNSHGLSLSDDGNRAYLAAVQGLIILDTSEIQARKPNPQAKVVSTLRWSVISIPQNAMPVTIHGKPFLVEVDEFSTDGPNNGSPIPTSYGSNVGGARIIDISDERAPYVVSNIRLEINQPENRAEAANDPGARSLSQGYASHYCGVPQEIDPGIVACSFIASGLRVFDIRNPYQPREIAYFVAPPAFSGGSGLPVEKSNYAMSRPSFAPSRGEIWYSDGNSGFYVIRLTNGVWPFKAHTGRGHGASSRSCTGASAKRRLAVSFFPLGGLARTRGKRLYARVCAPARVRSVKVVLSDLRGNAKGASVSRSFSGSRTFSIRLKQRLAPGRYRLTATGRNPNGRSASVSMRVRFR